MSSTATLNQPMPGQQLSPLSQYHLRQILQQSARQYASRLPWRRRGHCPVPQFHTDLTNVLQGRYRGPKLAQAIDQLEHLVAAYQSMQQVSYQRRAMTEIRRQIFQLLGLNVGADARLPMLIPETQVALFRFFYEDCLRVGGRYHNQLYGRIYQFQSDERFRAYQLVTVLSSRLIPVMLTESGQRLTLWVSLRSPVYAVLMKQGPGLFDSVLKLYGQLQHSNEAIVRA